MVLWNLSINADNKVRMADKGVLPSLVALLRSPEERIQELAVGTMRNLSIQVLTLLASPVQTYKY
jgi:hypothetical protein